MPEATDRRLPRFLFHAAFFVFIDLDLLLLPNCVTSQLPQHGAKVLEKGQSTHNIGGYLEGHRETEDWLARTGMAGFRLRHEEVA